MSLVGKSIRLKPNEKKINKKNTKAKFLTLKIICVTFHFKRNRFFKSVTIDQFNMSTSQKRDTDVNGAHYFAKSTWSGDAMAWKSLRLFTKNSSYIYKVARLQPTAVAGACYKVNNYDTVM